VGKVAFVWEGPSNNTYALIANIPSLQPTTSSGAGMVGHIF